MLPAHIRKFFWDINPQKAQPKQHPEYYIKRILELGDEKSVSWLKNVFGTKRVKTVAQKAKLTPKSKNYWKISL